jgi:hypothetical protein
MNELMALQLRFQKRRCLPCRDRTGCFDEEKLDDNTYIGRTNMMLQRLMSFYLTSRENVINKIVKSRVTDSIEYDLFGEII